MPIHGPIEQTRIQTFQKESHQSDFGYRHGAPQWKVGADEVGYIASLIQRYNRHHGMDYRGRRQYRGAKS